MKPQLYFVDYKSRLQQWEKSSWSLDLSRGLSRGNEYLLSHQDTLVYTTTGRLIHPQDLEYVGLRERPRGRLWVTVGGTVKRVGRHLCGHGTSRFRKTPPYIPG